MKKILVLIIYIFVFSLAAYLRLTGGNWDQDQHLHPDERFLTMVATAISWPHSWTQYFTTSQSPANPHNVGYNFYVYGTFPVYLVKFVSEFLHKSDYVNLTLVGRSISAVADLVTMLVVLLLAHQLSHRKLAVILAGFFYAVSVLPIQLSHFFAVDSFLTLFITLCLYLLVLLVKVPRSSKSLVDSLLLGLFFGLAVSCKITAVFLLPAIGLTYLLHLIKTKNPTLSILLGLVFVGVSLFTIRIAYPYLFSATGFIPTALNPQVLANWKELESYNQPVIFYPPAVSWIHVPSYIYPLENMMYWGLGLPLFAIVSLGLVFSIFLLRKNLPLAPLVLFFFVYFVYEGQGYALPMRYFYPLYPILAIFGSLLVSRFFGKTTAKRYILLGILLILVSVWPISFISIYLKDNSRINASNWIYTHIPSGSRISCEYWDDCLPLNFPSSPARPLYTTITYALYDPDTPEKWQKVNSDLENTDYIILSSNRLYGSIMTVPEFYPQTYQFYKDLFSGKLGFSLVAQFVSRPNLNIPFIKKCLTPPNIKYGQISTLVQTCDTPGLTIVDDYADETFTVYDHPKVLIFKKNQI